MGLTSSGQQGPRVYRVSELTGEIQALLESRFDFIWLEAEISNFSAPASGHYYMILKDERAQIRGVMFRPQARCLKFVPENGMKILAQGRIGVYAPRGEYQLLLDYLEPLGVGALALAFEQLKRKLAAEGLFDTALKRPLPFLPQRVALVTSPTGAAVRDFLKIIHRRFANLEVVVVPSRVQGVEALPDLQAALEAADRYVQPDVIVIARGGGSLEDLWPFNQEELARAIRRSSVPVVSAVGHETDWTIADMAADVRAPTPSAAAEILVKEKEELARRLGDWRQRLLRSIGYLLDMQEARLKALQRSVAAPARLVEAWWLRVDDLQGRLVRRMKVRLDEDDRRLRSESRSLRFYAPAARIEREWRQLVFTRSNLVSHIERRLESLRYALDLAQGRLRDLSPMAALQRGYSITFRLPEESVLRDAADVAEGESIRILLGTGSLEARVEKAESDPAARK